MVSAALCAASSAAGAPPFSTRQPSKAWKAWRALACTASWNTAKSPRAESATTATKETEAVAAIHGSSRPTGYHSIAPDGVARPRRAR